MTPHDGTETESVALPADVVERVEDRLPRTEWDEPGDYVTYVLEEVLYSVEADAGEGSREEVDEAEVKDRLRSLGYLDDDDQNR